MDRAQKRAVQREIYSQVARRFGFKSFQRTGAVVVTEEWTVDGGVSRTTKIDEVNEAESALLIQMLSLAPPQEDIKQPNEQKPMTEKPNPVTPESPKGDKAEIPSKTGEQSPASQQDDQEDIQDRVQHNSGMKRAADQFSPGDRVVDLLTKPGIRMEGEVVGPSSKSGYVNVLWDATADIDPIEEEVEESSIQKVAFKKIAGNFQIGDSVNYNEAGIAAAGEELRDGRITELPMENSTANLYLVQWPGFETECAEKGEWLESADQQGLPGITASKKTAGYSTRNGTKSEIQSIYSILELASTNDPGFKKPSLNEINDAISIGDNGTVTVFVGTLNGHPFGPDDDINSPGLDNSDGAWYELDGYYDQQETAHKRKTGSKKTITMANKKIGMKLMANEPVEVTGIDDTTLQTWFERDRAHVALVDAATEQNTIVEWWDEAVAEAVEDGFLDPRDYHQSAYDYAKQNGLLKEVAPKEEELGEDIFE